MEKRRGLYNKEKDYRNNQRLAVVNEASELDETKKGNLVPVGGYRFYIRKRSGIRPVCYHR
jgi:hypothetical protein